MSHLINKKYYIYATSAYSVAVVIIKINIILEVIYFYNNRYFMYFI